MSTIQETLPIKERIITCSLNLFNKRGYQAVLMSDIANEMSMSRGNLTYHLKDKEQIVEILINNLKSELKRISLLNNGFPSFTSIQNTIWALFKLQQKYAFIFNEVRLMKSFGMDNEVGIFAEYIYENMRKIIGYSIKSGNFKPEPFPGVYDNLIKTVWFICFNWINYDRITNESSLERLQKQIWSLLIINFTEKGINEFIHVFGDAYIKNLGPKFIPSDNYSFLK